MTDELAFISASDAAGLLRRGEVTSVELTRGQLERIEAFDSQLNAYITVTAEQALAEAERADVAIRAGQSDSPLLGVPAAIKDLFDTAGVRTTAGARILQDNVPDRDATAVRKLRAAGAVSLGKTNMMEFAYGYPHPDFGESANPWDTGRTAGGSSGGSAAAVAAGMAYAALGSDTGGSIRSPAVYCSLVGLKPTYGLVSRHGVVPLAWSLDHCGPLTRTVRDTALVLDAIAGYDPLDPASARVAYQPVADRLDRALGRVRVGVVELLFERYVQPEVRSVTQAAADSLAGLGWELTPVVLEHAAMVGTAIFPIVQAEATSFHWRNLVARPDDYSDSTRANLRLGATVLAKDYLDAQRLRAIMRAEVDAALETVDVLVFPTQPVVAPPLSIYHVAQEGEEDILGVEIGHTGLANLTGHPAVSVPCGFTEAGLPVGLQFTGRAFDEGRLLAVAHAFEAASGWHDRHPALPR